MHSRPATAGDPRIERSRAAVRQAALEELADVGYGRFAIESVAARAGVAKSTIYRHWRDKVELIADALEVAHHHAVPSLEPTSARDRVVLLTGHVAEVAVDPTFSRCIPALIEGAERDSRLRAFHHGYSAVRQQSLRDLIEAGISNGEFDTGTDIDLVISALLGAIFYSRLMTSEPYDPSRADELVELVLPRPASTESHHG